MIRAFFARMATSLLFLFVVLALLAAPQLLEQLKW